MNDTISALEGSIRITLSHQGIDEILTCRNAISTDCYSYLIDCLINSESTDPIDHIIFYYLDNGVYGSTVTNIITSKTTDKSARFTSSISNAINPLRYIYEARLRNSSNIAYSVFSLPQVNIPTGYTMTTDWTIAYP